MEMLITIRGEYDSTSADNQRMVWAPEAIWDKDKGEYMIYWSMEGGDVYKLNGQDKWILIADNNWEKYYSMAESDDLVHWDVVAEPDCTINPAGTFPGFRESIHRKMMTIAGGILRRRTKELSSIKYPRRIF